MYLNVYVLSFEYIELEFKLRVRVCCVLCYSSSSVLCDSLNSFLFSLTGTVWYRTGAR